MEQATGWKSQDDVIIPMTQADVQRQVMTNPEVIKAQATSQRIAQLHRGKMEEKALDNQHKLQQIDAKGVGAVGQDILTSALERKQRIEEMGELSGSLAGEE